MAQQSRCIMLSFWGCGLCSYLDVTTGAVLRYDPNATPCFQTEAPSLAAWLERWAASDAPDALLEMPHVETMDAPHDQAAGQSGARQVVEGDGP